jgi:hypothetical protein
LAWSFARRAAGDGRPFFIAAGEKLFAKHQLQFATISWAAISCAAVLAIALAIIRKAAPAQ